ncbi:uncharacterized protein B0H18DRAFT_976133 [Fomitopsis serialis]|uniref:uncharacterized protein n=1 Tax=Fomitopsis serialis TaxID=139415 RepID=UPI0020071FD6|nr:uncharacterized protein B0H18DRAFT_976133 [Neoantrodia serialis]KAH9935530.1 hypothetical protein B0H18DRAFT_976133 [Neoantrodia serialis]
MSTHAQTTYTHKVNADPRGADGLIRCPAHGDIAARFTSHTENNPNRDFYRCPRRDENPQCRFFIWADDPKLSGEPRFAHQQGSPRPAHTPNTPERHGRLSLRGSAAPAPASPQSVKRPRPDSPPPSQTSSAHQLPSAFPRTPTRGARAQSVTTPSSAYTPSQRRSRLAAIITGMEAAGPVQGTSKSPYVPSAAARSATPVVHSGSETPRSGHRRSEVETVPSHDQGLPVDTPEDDDDNDATSHPSPSKRSRLEDEEYDFSETGSLYSVGIQTSPRPAQSVFDAFDGMSERAVEVELDFGPGDPLSGAADTTGPDDSMLPPLDRLPPAFSRTGSPLKGSPSSHRRSRLPGDHSQGYLTPPESSEPQPDTRQLSRQSSIAPLDSPARWKGKGRDLGDQSHQQWRLEDDPENPFHDRASTVWASFTDNAHALESSRLEQSQSQVSGEGAPLPLADYVAAHLAGMHALPDQIRKLERQLKAAHNSIAARDRKIQQLQQDSVRLLAQNRALEATVEGLRARR